MPSVRILSELKDQIYFVTYTVKTGIIYSVVITDFIFLRTVLSIAKKIKT
jgi:hypothetical protein